MTATELLALARAARAVSLVERPDYGRHEARDVDEVERKQCPRQKAPEDGREFPWLT
jgi:hypothetical protein